MSAAQWVRFKDADSWKAAIEQAMARKKKSESDEPEAQRKVTDLEAIEWNAQQAVAGFMDRYMPMPRFDEGVEVMGIVQLRDVMGLRATNDSGDPWPSVEQTLRMSGYCWHMLGGERVMFLKDKAGPESTSLMPAGDDGWAEAEEWDDD